MSKPARKHRPAVDVNAEILAGVREVEARRGMPRESTTLPQDESWKFGGNIPLPPETDVPGGK